MSACYIKVIPGGGRPSLFDNRDIQTLSQLRDFLEKHLPYAIDRSVKILDSSDQGITAIVGRKDLYDITYHVSIIGNLTKEEDQISNILKGE